MNFFSFIYFVDIDSLLTIKILKIIVDTFCCKFKV
jgi:hypothetical protein